MFGGAERSHQGIGLFIEGPTVGTPGRAHVFSLRQHSWRFSVLNSWSKRSLPSWPTMRTLCQHVFKNLRQSVKSADNASGRAETMRPQSGCDCRTSAPARRLRALRSVRRSRVRFLSADCADGRGFCMSRTGCERNLSPSSVRDCKRTKTALMEAGQMPAPRGLEMPESQSARSARPGRPRP